MVSAPLIDNSDGLGPGQEESRAEERASALVNRRSRSRKVGRLRRDLYGSAAWSISRSRARSSLS